MPARVIHFGAHWRPRPVVLHPTSAEVIVLPVVISFEAAERLERRRRPKRFPLPSLSAKGRAR